MKMTKKMLAVALMAGSVLVLAGCNKTPAEPDVVIPAGDEMVVEPVVEVTPEEEVVVEDETMTGEATELEPVVIEQPVEVVAAE